MQRFPRQAPLAVAGCSLVTILVLTLVSARAATAATLSGHLTPGYRVSSGAGVSAPDASGLQLYARGLNPTNRTYEETLGYPAPGRGGTIGARVAAGR